MVQEAQEAQDPLAILEAIEGGDFIRAAGLLFDHLYESRREKLHEKGLFDGADWRFVALY